MHICQDHMSGTKKFRYFKENKLVMLTRWGCHLLKQRKVQLLLLSNRVFINWSSTNRVFKGYKKTVTDVFVQLLKKKNRWEIENDTRLCVLTPVKSFSNHEPIRSLGKKYLMFSTNPNTFFCHMSTLRWKRRYKEALFELTCYSDGETSRRITWSWKTVLYLERNIFKKAVREGFFIFSLPLFLGLKKLNVTALLAHDRHVFNSIELHVIWLSDGSYHAN